RYVALAIVNQPFVFTDEVEVFAGDPAWLAQPLPGGAVANVREGVAQLTGEAYIRRRLTRDLEAIRSAMAVAEIESAAKETLSAQAGALAQEVATSTPEYSPEMRAILPLNPLHERVLALQAALWRAQGQSPVTLWQSGLWDALPFLGAPPKEAAPALDVHCMQGEYRAASFNISNATEGPLDVSVQVEGLPGGPNPGYVRVHEVVWTDTNAGVPVAAALPEAPRGNGSYRIPVAAGITRQVWLTLCPPDVTAGTYEGSIHVMAPGLEARLPLRLHVYPIKFPPKPRLHFGGWDYTDVMSQYEVTPENRAALIALLREYFVDTPWATAASMPWGKYDAAGNMTEEPDTTLFDAWMDAWVDADQYRVFVAVSPGTLPFEPGSDAFEQAVRDWCVFWARQIRVANANNSRRFGLLLLDEPSKLEDQMLVTAWARAVRRSASDLRVWEDPVFRSATEADRSMLESCDILCPNRQIFLAADMEYRKLFVEDRAKDTALEFYSCSGPVRTLDPYSYHRLQAWDCWRYGATAEYFWAFGDSGGAYSWNEYAAQRSAYTPLFIDKTAVTPGKHLEACREGIEDYETLAMLDDALEAARESQGDPAWIAAAEEFLKTMPTRVCDEGYLPSMQWSDPLDRTLADQVRIQALELLAQRAK
ncbi:MAG: hypothetical protein HYV26_03885, partial [Candidatus Hydrogenedentes bacterium]|nr:hypothetical protein [Candidatus Hydrogenedentota bacterium]